MEHSLPRNGPALALLLAGVLTALGAKGAATTVRSLPAIRSRAEFDALARVTDTPYPLPHLLFVIDRRDKNRIYYVNSKRYLFHRDFVNSTYLSLERGQEFFANNFLKPNRRFILGTIAEQSRIHRWTFEFWEGDLIPADQIKLAAEVINRTFFQRVAFKPNSLRQEEASAAIPGLERVLENDEGGTVRAGPDLPAPAAGRAAGTDAAGTGERDTPR